jgi:hypothetical protein
MHQRVSCGVASAYVARVSSRKLTTTLDEKRRFVSDDALRDREQQAAVLGHWRYEMPKRLNDALGEGNKFARLR